MPCASTSTEVLLGEGGDRSNPGVRSHPRETNFDALAKTTFIMLLVPLKRLAPINCPQSRE